MFFGDRVRAAREAAGLSRVEVAALAGVSVPTLSRIEGAARAGGNVVVLRSVAKALGVTVDDLIGEDVEVARKRVGKRKVA